MKIGIIGAGAWGTALGITAAKAGSEILIWAREPEVVRGINNEHENKTYLTGIKLSSKIKATNSLEEAAKQDLILLVVPTQFMRGTCAELQKYLNKSTPIVICSKGIEQKSGTLLDAVIKDTLPQNPLAVLSGPTFAHEVAQGVPTALTLACENEEIGKNIIKAIGTSYFRPYLSKDIKGALVGGAIKNVLAIACGIIEGKKLGDNARAALLTRGLAEMARLTAALGGKQETLMGLSGLGDLVLTANSMQSRNFSLGFELGQGKSLNEILESRNSVAEGVYTASAVIKTASDLKLEMPICSAVNDIVSTNKNVNEIIENLLNRPFKTEVDRKII